jgi:hypothetical protein
MKKPRRIIFLATLVFLVGINVAYYNTASLIYERVNIFSFNNEEMQLYEMNIRYDDVKNGLEKLKKSFPSEHITI